VDRSAGGHIGPAAPASRALEEFVARVAVRLDPADDTTELDAATVQIFEAFAAAGVDALVLKGPALARLLYAEGETRVYGDVDLLVAPRHTAQAGAALAELGYRNASEVLGIDDIGGVVHDESWVGIGPGAKHELLIELHRRLSGSDAAPETAWEALAARRVDLELSGSRVPVLNREGLAMHLATHAAQHGPGYDKGLRELALGLERWSFDVWQRAAELAAEIEATGPFAAGLRLVPTGAELAATLCLPATGQLDWESRHVAARPRGTFHLEALFEARGALPRARVVRRALLPSRRWIAWQYPWAGSHGVRLAAARCIHVMRAPGLAFSAWRFRRRARRAGRPTTSG
jgi:hypothetical protein